MMGADKVSHYFDRLEQGICNQVRAELSDGGRSLGSGRCDAAGHACAPDTERFYGVVSVFFATGRSGMMT